MIENPGPGRSALESKQEALLRLLCHYLIYIGKATSLLENSTDEKSLLTKWKTQWNKPAEFTWHPAKGLEMHYRIEPPADWIVSSSEDESLSSIDIDLSEFDGIEQFTQNADLLKCNSCGMFWTSLDANGFCQICRPDTSSEGPLFLQSPFLEGFDFIDIFGASSPNSNLANTELSSSFDHQPLQRFSTASQESHSTCLSCEKVIEVGSNFCSQACRLCYSEHTDVIDPQTPSKLAIAYSPLTVPPIPPSLNDSARPAQELGLAPSDQTASYWSSGNNAAPEISTHWLGLENGGEQPPDAELRAEMEGKEEIIGRSVPGPQPSILLPSSDHLQSSASAETDGLDPNSQPPIPPPTLSRANNGRAPAKQKKTYFCDACKDEMFRPPKNWHFHRTKSSDYRTCVWCGSPTFDYECTGNCRDGTDRTGRLRLLI